ncbi:MAG TPA: hypothetical protein VL359_18885, partial [bacterium]|nr:hypothetical protein [bacterium]
QRVSRIVKDQIGDKLVSVVVHVGYVRVAAPAETGGPERIKLPGLNNYISAGGGPVRVSPEFARLRQVVVLISDDLAPRANALARDIRSQAELDESKGDWLQVVPVSTASPESKLAALAGAKPEAAGLPGTPPAPSGPPPTPPPSAGVLQEPRSTEFLIKAREAYFRGDYNGALDQILQAINAKADNPQAYAMLGSLYYALNWKSLALKYWEQSLAQDPSNRELEGLVAQLRATQN